METYKVIGLMSGTSLDGLDIAYCIFSLKDGRWDYEIVVAETVAYSQEFKNKLANIYNGSAAEIAMLHHHYGKFTGEEVKKFINKYSLTPDLIASHGHTVFHRPAMGFTFQIGSGADISAVTELPVVCDFRSIDVATGGQGAPLVPIGDLQLFGEYDMCLNLGGIANVSYDDEGKRMAFDICPVNIPLNKLAAQLGKPYDENGDLARKGNLNSNLLKHLNQLSYYRQPFPKSMGKEWIDENVLPLLKPELDTKDTLYTFSRHIAEQIAAVTSKFGEKKLKTSVLVTGGGAFNSFLIQLFEEYVPENISYIIPDKKTIMFKEALIFAFLGVLRVRNINNCLFKVTGAKKDTIGGALYGNYDGLISTITER
jgi:anhydro-N-acetylmuramic acid kinase